MGLYKCDFCDEVFATSDICLEYIESDDEEKCGCVPLCPRCERAHLLGFKEQEVNKK